MVKYASSILWLLIFISCSGNDFKAAIPDSDQDKTAIAHAPDLKKLKQYGDSAKKFCKTRKLNTDFYVLIDLSIHSGLKRFFIWDFKSDTIASGWLVSHGCASNPWSTDFTKEKAVVSNTHESHCSSIGKYIIGERGYSNWGINVKYLLHGQDATNSNALKREIVLHGWDEVPDVELFPAGTPEGWGCPAISNIAMRAVDARLKASKTSVLLWTIQ